MATVAVVGRVHAAGLDRLRAAGLDLAEIDEHDPAAILAAMPEATAIIVRTARITPEMLAAAPRLRIVSRHGVGWDNVPIERLNARRIPLAVSATANKIAVAEQAIRMMLELAKRGREHDRAVRQGDWAFRNRLAAIELHGKTLLVLGFGRVGREVAARARAFGMRILVHDPYIDPARLEAEGHAAASPLEAALPEADIVTLHLPLTGGTRHLIDAAALARLRPEAILINTARGGLVDEAALAAALREGRLRGAGIDVFEQEPPPGDHPLLALDNVLLSPHSAGVSREAAVRMAIESCDNVIAALAGRLDPEAVVNREVLS
jgi:D-3-phosphoglycerate dehydrogenase